MATKTDAETTTTTTTTLAAISPTASAALTTKEIVTTLPVTTHTSVISSTTEVDTTTAPMDRGGTDLPMGALVGGIVGGLAVVIVIVIVIVVVVRKRRSGKEELSDDDDDDDDTPPQPLPKLDEQGRVVRDPDDVISHPLPATPHSPGVYEDPDQPSTQTQIRDKRGSESHHYGNISVKNDSSVGAYIVPLDHRPVESPPTSPTSRNGDLQSKGFEMDAGDSNGHGEEMYMPMDLGSSTQRDAEPRDGGSTYVASDLPKPPPCTPKKQHRYANVPCGEPLSGQNGSYKNYPEEDAHHYGNVSMPDGVDGSAASFSSAPEAAASYDASTSAQAGWIPLPKLPANQQSKLSPKPGLKKVAPKPSPKPSPKQVREATVNSSPKPSPKPFHVEPPRPSPKPSPSAKLSPPAGAAAVPSSFHRPESDDSDSEGENYENLKVDYVNAPEKNRDYVNAPKKKISK